MTLRALLRAAVRAAEAAVADGSKTKEQLTAEIGSTKDAYSAAHAKYLKEQEDVVAAREKVERFEWEGIAGQVEKVYRGGRTG